MVHQGLIVRIDRTETVAQEVELILQPQTWRPKAAVLANRLAVSPAAGNKAPVRRAGSRCVAKAVSRTIAHRHRRAHETTHRCLHSEERSLVQGADDNGRKKSVDLLVDYIKRKRLLRPQARFVRAGVSERPGRAIESHLDLRRATER